VLDTLSPDERLAFVLHDMFDLPFAQIATMIGRTPAAAKQLASRARRRVKGAAAPADPDLARQREVVDAFFAAARRGDFDALVAVLHPGVLLRIDAGARIDARAGAAPSLVHGAAAVARQAVEGFRQAFGRPGAELHPVLVNGAAGVVVTLDGQPLTVMSFTIADGKVTGIDAISDPGRVRGLAAAVLPGARFAYVKDPEGNLIELIQPAAPATGGESGQD
jgi:catechol 2,3-dioxygenase-like lactoylglutathione lyase family enzyme